MYNTHYPKQKTTDCSIDGSEYYQLNGSFNGVYEPV